MDSNRLSIALSKENQKKNIEINAILKFLPFGRAIVSI